MSAQAPLRFRGTPFGLAALAGAPRDEPRQHVLRLAAPERALLAGGRELHAMAAPGDVLLRTHVPRSTPPGTYRATVEIDGEEREVEIEVEPEAFLSIFPALLKITAAPGAQVGEQLTIANLGNVPVDIRGAYGFGVFDEEGAERAVGKMMTAGEDERRADVLANAAAEEHGGIVRVKVESGEGELPPGETRSLDVSFHIPPKVRPGHSYTGIWPLYNLGYYVRLTGVAGKGQRTRS